MISPNISFDEASREFFPDSQCLKFKFVSGCLTVVFISSLLLNSIVFLAYSMMKRRKSLELQTMTLLFFNLVSTCSSIPVLIISNYSCKWVGPRATCILSGFWMYFNGVFSIYLMTGISVER